MNNKLRLMLIVVSTTACLAACASKNQPTSVAPVYIPLDSQDAKF